LRTLRFSFAKNRFIAEKH